MNLRDAVKGLLSLGAKLLDSDGDGKVEISDIPGALRKAAALKSHGETLVQSAKATYDAIASAAKAGVLTQDGQLVSADDVAAAWEAARVPFRTAAEEARAVLAKAD